MKVSASLCFSLAVTTALIFAIGCGGGGGGAGTTGTTGTAAQLTKATNDLSTAFQNTSYTSSDFTQAANEFNALAGCGSSSDPRADAGYALAALLLESLKEYQTVTSQTSLNPQNAPTTGLFANVFSAALPFSNPKVSPNPVETMVGSMIQPQAGFGSNFVFQLSDLPVWSTALSNLNTVIHQLLSCELTNTNINNLEYNPLILIVPLQNGKITAGSKTTVKVGSAEMYSLRASLYYLAGILDELTSYSMNTGSFNLDAEVAPALASHVNGPAFSMGGTVIPASPFLTRTSNPGSEVFSFFNDGANDVITAANIVNGRPTNSGYLLNDLNLSSVDLTQIKDEANLVLNFLNSTQTENTTINSKSETLQINIKAFLENPLPDLKTLFPTVTYNGTFVTENSYPDPTFGGIIVNGQAAFADAYGGQPINRHLVKNAVTPTITFRQWYGLK